MMRIWDWLTRLWIRLFVRPVVPREPVSLRAVAVVRNSVLEPRMDGWEDVRSDIIVREDLEGALDGLEGYSHLLVLFYAHRIPDEEKGKIHIHPRGDSRYPLVGIFATRSQLRPNAIGATIVPLLRRRKNILRVRGLDAINGTPVLDIKPYVPHYDSVADARVPDWITRPPLADER
jgi:tRNA-Thr(GGU) m(6)t(6)A37 methyltransferase TsaA